MTLTDEPKTTKLHVRKEGRSLESLGSQRLQLSSERGLLKYELEIAEGDFSAVPSAITTYISWGGTAPRLSAC